MAIRFSPRFQIKGSKLKEWQAARQMGSPATPPTIGPVVQLEDLIAAQGLPAERASGDGG